MTDRIERELTRHAIAAAPWLTADTIEGALVRVTGVVMPIDDRLVSILTSTPCVLYRARGRRGVVDRYETLALHPFDVLDDDGQRTTIIGDHARLDVPLTTAPIAVDRRRHFQLLHAATTAITRLREAVVRAGDRVTVAGTLTREIATTVDHELGFRDVAVDTRLVGSAEQPLLISARAARS